MTRICKSLVISAFVIGGFTAMHASTLTLGSYATTVDNPGYENSATSYVPGSSTVNDGSTATYDISAGSVWHSALGSSSYVSYDPGTGADLTTVAPNGDYIYTTTFTIPEKTTDNSYEGSLTVLADDTLSVYLNGTLILSAASGRGEDGNNYAHCSNVVPNCVTPFTFSFDGISNGLNVLTFDVEQVGSANEGLDYEGTIVGSTAPSLDSVVDPTPEPSSLILLGTGMTGLAMLVRSRFSK
jgi:hypothetical protein